MQLMRNDFSAKGRLRPTRVGFMKTNYKASLALLAGVALGGGAVQGLHAQATPPVYLVSEVDVTNPEAYGKEFAPKVQASIKAAGGHSLAIGGSGGVGAGNVTAFDGVPPKRVAIQGWGSLEQLRAWYNGAEYTAARQIGDQDARC